MAFVSTFVYTYVTFLNYYQSFSVVNVYDVLLSILMIFLVFQQQLHIGSNGTFVNANFWEISVKESETSSFASKDQIIICNLGDAEMMTRIVEGVNDTRT